MQVTETMTVRAKAGESGLSRYFWWVVAAIAGVFIAGHLPFLGSPFVNLESWWALAAEELLRGDPAAALRTFEVTNANPLLSVAGVVPFLWALGPTEMTTRLFSLICASGVILVVGAMARREFEPAQGILAALLVAVNPVLWTWGGLAYSDAPFVLLIAGALALTCAGLRAADNKRHAAAAVLLGLAFLTKYNAAAAYVGTGLVLVLAAWRRSNQDESWLYQLSRVATIYIILAILIVGPYLLWTRATLGHVLSSRFVSSHFGALVSVEIPLLIVLRLAAYLVWLGIFVGPAALLYLPILGDVWHRSRAILSILLALLVLNVWLAALLASEGGRIGEIELGWFVHVAPHTFVVGLMAILLTLGELTVVLFFRWGAGHQGVPSALAAWFAAIIFVHAFVTASNRYTLFFLPALAPFLADLIVSMWAKRPKLTNAVIVPTVVLFLGLGLFNSAYFSAEGRAAAALAAYINTHRLEGIPSGNNQVLTHNSYLINPELFASSGSGKTRYDLKTFGSRGPIPDLVHAEDVRLIGIVFKRYALLRHSSGQ